MQSAIDYMCSFYYRINKLLNSVAIESMDTTDKTQLSKEEEDLKKAKVKELIVQALQNLKPTDTSVPELATMTLEEKQAIFLKEEIYLETIKNVPLAMGKRLSKEQRKVLDISSDNFAYGEIVI